jgi:branched-chain amino acid transport system permease protein
MENRKTRFKNYIGKSILPLFFLVMVLVPFVSSNYTIRMFSSIFMYASLSIAFNIMLGYCGYAAFGNVAFFGTSAYVTAIILNRTGVYLVVAILASGIFSAVFAILLGLPILRLKGHYFAIGTIGIAEGTREIITNLPRLTGGGKGLSIPIGELPVTTVYIFIYFLFFSLTAFSMLACYFLLRKPMGYAWRTIRGDEDAAKGMGINTTYYKIAAWCISAFITGIAGGIYAFWMGYIDPPSVFDNTIAVKYTVIALVGGLGTIIGPVIGAFLIELLSVFIWSTFLKIHLAILGITVMVIVVFMPKGLMSFSIKLRTRFKSVFNSFINGRKITGREN